MGEVDLIHSGVPWPHEQPPCCRKMIHYLERNEEIVSWVQVPVSQIKLSGRVTDTDTSRNQAHWRINFQ